MEDLQFKLQRLQVELASVLEAIKPPEPQPATEEPTEPPTPLEPNDTAVVVTYIWYQHKPPELSITAHPVLDRTPMGLLWRKDDSTERWDELKQKLAEILSEYLRV